MAESNQTSAVPLRVSIENKNKPKIFYEHGKDALRLALSVANMQEEKALRKAGKHRRPQADESQAEQKSPNRASKRRKRLEKAKVMIVHRRAEAKKEKARSRKESQSRLRQGDGTKVTALEDKSATPRKKVSFA